MNVECPSKNFLTNIHQRFFSSKNTVLKLMVSLFVKKAIKQPGSICFKEPGFTFYLLSAEQIKLWRFRYTFVGTIKQNTCTNS